MLKKISFANFELIDPQEYIINASLMIQYVN